MIRRSSFKPQPFCDLNDNQVIFFLIISRFLKFIFNSSSTRCCIIMEEDTVFKIFLPAFIDLGIFTYPLELTCWCLRQVVVNKVLRSTQKWKLWRDNSGCFKVPLGSQTSARTNSSSLPLKSYEKRNGTCSTPWSYRGTGRAAHKFFSCCNDWTNLAFSLLYQQIHVGGKKNKTHLVLQYFQHWQWLPGRKPKEDYDSFRKCT